MSEDIQFFIVLLAGIYIGSMLGIAFAYWLINRGEN